MTIIVITFIALGKYLEAKSKLKTGDAIEKLLNLQAKTALVLKDGNVAQEERYLGELRERIRDVRQAPDGSLYLLTDSGDGQILRITPAAKR